MKLNREALMTYLDTAFNKKVADASKATFEVIGEDIEEMSTELNADVERIKNILGKTKVRDRGYEPSTEATPFFADPESALYPKMRDIAMDRKKGDECKTLMLEVIIEDTAAETHTAYLREVFVKVNSYGGSTDGLNFPFTVTEDGDSVKGTVTAASVKAGNPTFTAA